MSTKKLLLGEFKSLGEISKIFLNSLGVTVDRKFDRLCVENKVDLENIKDEVEKYFKSLVISKNSLKLIAFEDGGYKLSSNLIKQLKDSFFQFYGCYVDLINETTIFTTQEKLNGKMLENFFIPYIDTLMKDIFYHYKNYLYIENIQSTDYYNQIKKIILKKIEKDTFTFLIDENNSFIKEHDNTSYKDYRLISNIGKNFHSDVILNEIINSILSDEKINFKIKREDIELSFFFARMHQEFIKELSKEKEIKIRKLSIMNKELVNEMLNDLSKGEVELYKEIKILDSLKKRVNLHKEIGEANKEDFLKEYKFIENIGVNFKWFLKHIKGRYLVMNNEYEEALQFYEDALKLGSYRAGKLLNKIIKEGLVLSAYLKKKKSFEKFYKRAYSYNLIQSQFKNEEEWIMDHFRKDFDTMFFKDRFYKKNEKMQTKQNFYTLNEDTIPRLNINKPNSKHELWDRKRSQLEIFSSLPAFDIKTEKKYQNYMRQLISAGADINFINSTGETPLIGAICLKNYERALILLENKEIKDSVNQISNRKKNTALSVLLENLDIENSKAIEVLEKLIENGVDLNKEATIDNMIPLHQIMSYFVKRVSTDKRKFKNIDIEGIRRVVYRPGANNCYFTKDILANMKILNSPEGKQILNFVDNTNARNKSLYLKIIEIFLNNGSNVNIPWKGEITPFMYSLEIGDMELFKLLLNYNPDITKKCHLGNDVLAISSGYNNFEIFKYLIDTYEFSDYKTESFMRLFETTFLLNYDEKADYSIALQYLLEFINNSKLSAYDKFNIKSRFSKKLNRMI